MLEFLRNMVTMRRDRNERGASAVEYGLLIAGIAAVVAVTIFAFSGSIKGLFDQTCSSVENNGVAVANGTC